MKSPILFLIFNRPDTTEKVFETIRNARPPRLYVAADGPRPGREGEKELCDRTRAIATAVDWPCEVHTLFRDSNLGCGKAVCQAITWFFDHEPEGIILEDDILAHPDFFPYCDEMLDRYRSNPQIGIIAGHNHLYKDFNRQHSYAYLSVPHIWGWATWKENWDLYDFDLNNITKQQLKESLQNFGYDKYQTLFWVNIYELMKNHHIDTWDYQWAITLMGHGKLNPTPYSNLTKNIGFSSDATHTAEGRSEEIHLITKPILPITHPHIIEIDVEAERIESNNETRSLTKIGYLKNRIKRFLSIFKNKALGIWNK